MIYFKVLKFQSILNCIFSFSFLFIFFVYFYFILRFIIVVYFNAIRVIGGFREGLGSLHSCTQRS